MVKKNKSNDINVFDIIGLLVAIAYMQSVLTVAHHTSMWVHDGTSYTVGPPAVPALVIGLIIVCYSTYKNKYKLTTLTIISLTILATASIFWLSGLRTNFYLQLKERPDRIELHQLLALFGLLILALLKRIQETQEKIHLIKNSECYTFYMSFQAYLDNIETKTGKTPNEFIELANAKGFNKDTKSGEIVAWLKQDFELGHGHAMALVHVIKNGAGISNKHVDSGGTHSDDSNELRLDGIKNR